MESIEGVKILYLPEMEIVLGFVLLRVTRVFEVAFTKVLLQVHERLLRCNEAVDRSLTNH
jgi:hypothetical protein